MGKLQQQMPDHHKPADHREFQDRDDGPPQIPPRIRKKKGPTLPEKPPHIRGARTDPSSCTPSHAPREPLRPRILNLDAPPQPTEARHREVLVAASKSSIRERPAEKRQREPAKLLAPTSTGRPRRDPAPAQCSRTFVRLEEIAPPTRRKEAIATSRNWSLERSAAVRKPRPLQPVLLIPRNLLTTWGSSSSGPASYALWSQRESGRAAVPRQGRPGAEAPETSGISAVRLRSSSVTRSGSLTSQGSSGSESGGETFPKSVLKKHRRAAAAPPTAVSLGHGSNRRVDQKKNVTFNAFAIVQLMEE